MRGVGSLSHLWPPASATCPTQASGCRFKMLNSQPFFSKASPIRYLGTRRVGVPCGKGCAQLAALILSQMARSTGSDRRQQGRYGLR
ncbi:hypothetical protein BC834DRAFT_295652 [Gloeopeniophorella convolvens]|nr:hypothetical protein BC834DRAFT_295652 [Gloeopeniophorella convolvens]